jgi:methionyl-tRNA synthetase
MAKFYVTTPIYYINDKPHIGHAYSTIAADVIARFHRQQGEDVLFSTGTDENSQKTVQAAEASGQDIQAYTNSMAKTWEDTWSQLGITQTRFIRTTEADHKKAVYEFIKSVEAAGDIYKGDYEGLYCVGHEAYMRPDELVEGKCPEHNTVPEKRKEENYFFRLSKYQQKLLDYIHQNPDFVLPQTRRNEVVAFIERGLHDFPISRANAKWGIPWPGDEKQAVYVWFDALINYLTVAGYPSTNANAWWPADLHVVGKDIIKFHCIYWPAMLMSAGLPLPETVFGTGFFTIDGQKISKSLGNAIDPLKLAGQYGVDALRYYLMREIPFGNDGEFSHERFEKAYETDLANELGNLVQRVAVMIERYQSGAIGEVPQHTHDTSAYYEAMASYRLDRALAHVWDEVRGLNQYIEEEKPWELAKTDQEQLADVLAHAVSDLTQIASMILPFMPMTSQKITETFAGGQVNSNIGILFPKFEEPKKA